MDKEALVEFVRQHGIGIVATDDAELIFDTSASSRKVANLKSESRGAVGIGWDDEVTVQCEGIAGVLDGATLDRCLPFYFAHYPDGIERAKSPNILHIRIKPRWVRQSDFRPETFGSSESTYPDH